MTVDGGMELRLRQEVKKVSQWQLMHSHSLQSGEHVSSLMKDSPVMWSEHELLQACSRCCATTREILLLSRNVT